MHPRPTVAPEEWSALLHARGLRSTKGRVMALSFIEDHPHSSAAEIYRALADALPSFSQQSVHNITNDLTAHGLLRRIDLPEISSALFETRTDDNHHHVQCVVCHRIEDIDCVVGAAPCLSPDHSHGMRLLEAAVVFRGVCAACDATGAIPEAATVDSGPGSRASDTEIPAAVLSTAHPSA